MNNYKNIKNKAVFLKKYIKLTPVVNHIFEEFRCSVIYLNKNISSLYESVFNYNSFVNLNTAEKNINHFPNSKMQINMVYMHIKYAYNVDQKKFVKVYDTVDVFKPVLLNILEKYSILKKKNKLVAKYHKNMLAEKYSSNPIIYYYILNNYWKYIVSLNNHGSIYNYIVIYNKLKNSPFIFIEIIFSGFKGLNYFFFKKDAAFGNKMPRIFYRARYYNYDSTFNMYPKIQKNNFIKIYKNNFLKGVSSAWYFLRRWLLSIILSFVSLYCLILIKVLPFSVVIFEWFALGMFSYWLISGFVFFIKKYRFTRFTSAIQRFWRRSYILFWLIESNLLIVFFYLALNSSQETYYMFDEISAFKTHLFSWKLFLPKLLVVTVLVISGYLLLLNIKWNIFKKNNTLLLFITLVLTYLLWLEFYQIYHVSNFYANFFWSYDMDERLWSLEYDARRTRLVNHYMMILFFLKFWHIVFIYGFWVFFVLRSLELTRVRYPIYSANFQNFIILYFMTWLFMYPWLKMVFTRYMEYPYFWFYVNNRNTFIRVFFNDIKLIFWGVFDNFFSKNSFRYSVYDFIYFIQSNKNTNFVNFRKSWIRDNIIINLIK